jgi:uncharacterized protein GlcG (DUF336 family)
MAKLNLEQASAIVDAALAKGRDLALGPISVAVLDDGAHLVAFKREDGRGAALRPAIAIGKAWGAVGMGMPSRSLEKRALASPSGTGPGGGVGRSSGAGSRRRAHPRWRREIIGGVGVTGDTSDNDEACAVAGIIAAGLVPDTGE